MRKHNILVVVLVIAMLFGAVTTPAKALVGTGWATGIKLQNLTETLGTITVSLTNTAGVQVSSISTTAGGSPLTVAGGSSVEVYLPSYSSVPGGDYSATISSDVQLGAVATMTNYASGIADSYNSMEPATKVFVPYVYHNHRSWNTEIFIQNVNNFPVSGSIALTEPTGGTSSSDGLGDKLVPFNIPAYGRFNFNSADAAHADLGWFIGAAIVTATEGPVAVNSTQIRLLGVGDVKGNVLIQSRGLATLDAGSVLTFPSLYKEYTGASGTWNSGIKIQNPLTTEVGVQVVFTKDKATSPLGTSTFTIPANGSKELYLPGVVLDGGGSIANMFLGSAVATVTTAGGSILGNVQHTNYAAGGGYGVAQGYAAFSSGTAKVSLPTLYNWPSGAGKWLSGIKIQNYGSDPVDVVVTVKNDPDSPVFTGTKTFTNIAPGAAVELYLPTVGIFDGGLSIPATWKGSAMVVATGTNPQIVATAINTNYGRHVANMYTGIPVK